MSPEDFSTLDEDIRENGLQVRITTLDGQILDGQHRFPRV